MFEVMVNFKSRYHSVEYKMLIAVSANLILAGYTGRLCDTNIDDCESISCQHGQCIDGIDIYACNCDPGYTGQLCEVIFGEETFE